MRAMLSQKVRLANRPMLRPSLFPSISWRAALIFCGGRSKRVDSSICKLEGRKSGRKSCAFQHPSSSPTPSHTEFPSMGDVLP